MASADLENKDTRQLLHVFKVNCSLKPFKQAFCTEALKSHRALGLLRQLHFLPASSLSLSCSFPFHSRAQARLETLTLHCALHLEPSPDSLSG